MRTAVPLVVFIALVAAAAFIGARFTPGEWYDSLQRPPLAPPNWIFGPVWTLLYIGIAVAGFLIWRSPETSRLALALWGTQLTLNALWSYLFFGLERPGLALVEISILLMVIVATTLFFFRIRPMAGALFVPYTMWVSFATYLNAGFWYLNR